jgi:hypothetical protein
VACAPGLHIGTYNYAHGTYGGAGSIVLAVLVDPADVVSVPTDHNNQKCRCCAFKVLSTVTKEYDPNQLVVITDIDVALKLKPAEETEKTPIQKTKIISTKESFVIINKIDYKMSDISENDFRDKYKGPILIQPSKRLKYFKDLGNVVAQMWKIDTIPTTYITRYNTGKYVLYEPTKLDDQNKTVVKTTAKKTTAKKKVTTKTTATKTKSKAAKKSTVTIANKEYKVTQITVFNEKGLTSVKPSARNAYFKSLDIIEKMWKSKDEYFVLTHDDRYFKYTPVKK